MISFSFQFEEYERAWESDPEEEAFVDSLALKLMEDAADGPVDMDDEDPDTDDWGDMYADDDAEHEDPESNKDAVDVEEESDDDGPGDDDEDVGLKDEDDFMDAVDDSDDSESLEMQDDLPRDEDDIHESSDKDESGSSGNENDLVFVEEDDDDDEEESEEEEEPRSKKKARKMDSMPTFADADEYAEMINKDFETLLVKGSGSQPKRSSGKKQRRKK